MADLDLLRSRVAAAREFQDVRSAFDQVLAHPDAKWVSATVMQDLRRSLGAAIQECDRPAAEAVIGTASEAIQVAAQRERSAMAASRFRSATDLVAAIEREGGLRLRLGDGGAIECIGGYPADHGAVLALNHYADAVRGILSGRQQVVVLVPGEAR